MASTTSNSYYKLDEDGVPLENMKGTESTEHLRDNAPDDAIVRTTRITVTNDTHSSSEHEGRNLQHIIPKHGWAR